jgi:hypothetical protein
MRLKKQMNEDHSGRYACQKAKQHFYQEAVPEIFHTVKGRGFKGHHQG